MARPEDTLARGAGRNAGGFEQAQAQGYDDGLQGQRRVDPRMADPRSRNEAPMRGPNQSGIPLAPDTPRGAQPGVTPRFDPYLPQGNPAPPRQQAADPSRGYADPRTNGRQDPRLDFPPQGQQAYSQDPYQQQPPTQRAAPAGAPNGQRPPQQQMQPPAAPPMAERRYAAPAAGERGGPVQQPPQVRQTPPGATQGRPGATQRPVANGYAPPAAAQQQEIVPPTRRDPQLDGQAKRLPPAAPNGAARQQPYGQAQDGYGDDPYAHTAEAGGGDDEFEADDEEEYAEEPAPRSRRGMYVLVALAAAVIIGGGLGYGYKLSMGNGKSGAPRVVQTDKTPVKTVPVDAGGQSFAAGKKSILDRPGETADGGASTVVSSQEQLATTTEGNATSTVRKVQTVPVKPGQPIEADVAPLAAADDLGVPGITLGEPDAAPVKPKVPDAAQLKKAKAAVAQKATEAVAATEAAVGDVAADAQQVAAEAVDQPVKLVPVKTPAVAAAVKKVMKAAVAEPAADPAAEPVVEAMNAPPPKAKAAPAAPAATAKPASTGGGYILQVFSGKTQAESLGYFADMKQKFGDLLGDGQPDIQEVDLGAQGKKYRLRIGPPGSGTAVKNLCTKLKASGLKDCIVAAY
jgi:SPOR domain